MKIAMVPALNETKTKGSVPFLDVSYDEYLGESLKDPAEAAAYLEAVMELGDKTLFKALSAEGNPTLTTVHKVLHAVGLRLSVVPEHA